MRVTLAFTIFASVVSHAQGQELPRYDVAAHCKEVAGFGGTFSQSTENFCINEEQKAYNNLKMVWGNFSSVTRAHCLEIAGFGGGNYTTLDFCMREENTAAKNKPEFKF